MKQIVLTLVAVGFAFTLALGSAPEARAAGRSPQPKVNAKALRELLTKGLKVTRDDEKEFIDLVVSLVVDKKVPVAMVYASFRYARKRRPSYPYPYFVYSLKTLAKRKKIEI